MKRNAVIRLILFSAIALVLSCVLLVGLGRSSFSKSVPASAVSLHTEALPITDELEFASEDVRQLLISWAAGEINIQPADQNTITITEEGHTASSMVVRHAGAKLVLEYDDSKWKKGTKKDLTVRVPRGWNCLELEIDAASGDIRVSGLSIGKVVLNTASSDSTFADCVVEEMQVNTASGELDYSGVLKRLQVDGASADCELSLTDAPEAIQMNTISGDLELKLPDNCGFTLNKSTLSGSFASDFGTSVEDGNIVCGDGACQIEFNGLSGDIEIRRK